MIKFFLSTQNVQRCFFLKKKSTHREQEMIKPLIYQNSLKKRAHFMARMVILKIFPQKKEYCANSIENFISIRSGNADVNKR